MSSSAYTIEIPSDKDVLCGKGVGSINHIGNIYYHSYVHSLKHLYKQTKTHIDKRGILKKIIEHMTISRGGHFVRYVDGLWIEQSNDKSILTVLDCIRKKIDTPNKYIRVVVPVSDALPSSAKKQSTPTLELGPSSYVKEDFLANNPQLNQCIWEVYDSIFLHGTFRPEDMNNDLGIVLSGDSVRGNDPKINVNRNSYYRRNFGRPVLLPPQTDNPNTEWRSTYGTGSGTRTHGTPQG